MSQTNVLVHIEGIGNLMNGNVIVKKGRERIDYKRTDAYKKARKLAEAKYTTMTDDEKKEAHRNIGVNDMNLPGLPAFFPPPLLFSHGIGNGESTEVLECGHRWKSQSVNPKGERTYKCKYGHEFHRISEEHKW